MGFPRKPMDVLWNAMPRGIQSGLLENAFADPVEMSYSAFLIKYRKQADTDRHGCRR
jgi:hypothetical protein